MVRCIRAHQSTTMVVIIIYCAYYERLEFSLSDDVFIFKKDGILRKL